MEGKLGMLLTRIKCATVLKYGKWLGTRWSMVVPGNYGDDGRVSSSRYSGHGRPVRYICYYKTQPFFYLPTKHLAPFSIHIPTKKPSFTLINDFVVDS